MSNDSCTNKKCLSREKDPKLLSIYGSCNRKHWSKTQFSSQPIKKQRSSLDLKKGDLHDRISFKKFYEQNHFSGEGNSQLYAVCLKKKTKMHPFFI